MECKCNDVSLFYCVFLEFGCFLSLNPAWHHSHTGKKWEWWEQTDSDRLNLCVPDWITSHCSSPSAWTAEDSLDPLQQHSVVAAQGVTSIKPTSNLDILFQDQVNIIKVWLRRLSDPDGSVFIQSETHWDEMWIYGLFWRSSSMTKYTPAALRKIQWYVVGVEHN